MDYVTVGILNPRERGPTGYTCRAKPLEVSDGFVFYRGGGGVVVMRIGANTACAECVTVAGAKRHIESPCFEWWLK